MAKRSYRYRCYPTAEQRAVLARTFGCARFIYNWALALRRDAYAERRQMLSYSDLSTALTVLKKVPAYIWLNEVSSVPVQRAVSHLHQAYTNFFATRAKYPKFKRKHALQSATYVSVAFNWDGQAIRLAKMRDPLEIRWSRRFAGEPSSVTVTRD